MYPRASRVGLTTFLDKEGDPSGNGNKEKANKRGFLPDMSDEDLEASLRPLIARQAGGDIMRACKILKRDNAQVREQNRKANEALAGRTELSDGDKLLLEAVKKHKFTPETLEAAVKENKDLKATNAENAFAETVKEAAKAFGMNPLVLKDQLTTKKMHLEIREVHVQSVNDKKETVTTLKKIPHVRPAADATAPLTPLNVWATTLEKPYQQALASKEDGTPNKESTTSFVAFPEQPDGNKAPTKVRAVDSHIKQMYGTLPNIPGVVMPESAKQGA